MSSVRNDLNHAAYDEVPNKGAVLIVDDHADSLFYAQQATEIFGYSAFTLEEGSRTVEVATAQEPAVILLDICLRDTSGFEVISQLKQDERTAHIPVVAATAMVGASTREEAIESGFADFLAKPYTLNDLETVLSRHVS